MTEKFIREETRRYYRREDGGIIMKIEEKFFLEMKLVDSNDPVLKQECEKFNFLAPQVDLQEFSDELIETMHKNHGLGLSANQVGGPLQIFTM